MHANSDHGLHTRAARERRLASAGNGGALAALSPLGRAPRALLLRLVHCVLYAPAAGDHVVEPSRGNHDHRGKLARKLLFLSARRRAAHGVAGGGLPHGHNPYGVR